MVLSVHWGWVHAALGDGLSLWGGRRTVRLEVAEGAERVISEVEVESVPSQKYMACYRTLRNAVDRRYDVAGSGCTN